LNIRFDFYKPAFGAGIVLTAEDQHFRPHFQPNLSPIRVTENFG